MAPAGTKNKIAETYKKKLLASYLIDPQNTMTVKQICKAVGISQATYYKWTKDAVSLVNGVASNSDLITLATREALYRLRIDAVNALGDVVNSKVNPLARVRAAELILQLSNEELSKDEKGNDESQTLADLLASRGSTFVTVNVMNGTAGKNQNDEQGDNGENFIDGDFEEVPQRSLPPNREVGGQHTEISSAKSHVLHGVSFEEDE